MWLVRCSKYLFSECHYFLKFDMLDTLRMKQLSEEYKLWKVIMHSKLLKQKVELFTGDQILNWASCFFLFWPLNIRFCFLWGIGNGSYVYLIYQSTADMLNFKQSRFKMLLFQYSKFKVLSSNCTYVLSTHNSIQCAWSRLHISRG